MNAFYIEDGRLCEEDLRHAQRVLRLKVGEEIVALDGKGGRFRARLGEDGLVETLEALPSNEPKVRLTVYQGVPKADKMDFLAQKLTELGAWRLVPVAMERSVRRLERVDRLRKIAREAAKQCHRALPVEVCEAMSWQEALEDMRLREQLIAPWEQAREGSLLRVPPCADIGLLIGPEGGIAPREIRECGAHTVTLGARILRTETAAVAAAAIIMAAMGEL